MIYIVQKDLAKLNEKYDERLVNKAIKVVDKYTLMIESDAKEIIKSEGAIDQGGLIGSIHSSVMAYAEKIKGEVGTVKEYSRFIHEGAEHKGDKIVPHYVPFDVVEGNGLFIWAKRHKVIEKINGTWWYIDKNNQEHAIDIETGGLKVYSKPIKFFEKPFESLKEQFVKELAEIVGGNI